MERVDDKEVYFYVVTPSTGPTRKGIISRDVDFPGISFEFYSRNRYEFNQKNPAPFLLGRYHERIEQGYVSQLNIGEHISKQRALALRKDDSIVIRGTISWADVDNGSRIGLTDVQVE